MEKRGPIFEKIYHDYLRQMQSLDFREISRRLNLTLEGEELIVPFFHRTYRVSKQGIVVEEGDAPIYAECVVLAKYILLTPKEPPPCFSQWWTFKDFRDAAPFAGAFHNNVEKAIARNFSGRIKELEMACRAMGGMVPDDMSLSYELVQRFHALPTMDMLLVFNDVDEEFPAEARVLFPDNASHYLDMECLAISGWLLADYLYLQAGGTHYTIM